MILFPLVPLCVLKPCNVPRRTAGEQQQLAMCLYPPEEDPHSLTIALLCTIVVGLCPLKPAEGSPLTSAAAGTGAAIGLEDDYIFDYSAVIMLRVVFCVSCQEALTVRQFS